MYEPRDQENSLAYACDRWLTFLPGLRLQLLQSFIFHTEPRILGMDNTPRLRFHGHAGTTDDDYVDIGKVELESGASR